MIISKQDIVDVIAAYLHREIGLDDLVDWAERAMLEGEFDLDHAAVLAEVVARLGVSDVREFGLAWEDCEELLARLGYKAQIEITTA